MTRPVTTSRELVVPATGDIGLEPTPVSAANPLPVKGDGGPDGAIGAAWGGTARAAAGEGAASRGGGAMNGAWPRGVKPAPASPPSNQVDVFNAAGSRLATAIRGTGIYSVPVAGNVGFNTPGGAPAVNLILK